MTWMVSAVRKAGLLEQRLRLLGIVRQQRYVGALAEIAGRDDRLSGAGEVLALELHDLVAVDRIGYRLPHAQFVEGRLGDIEVEHRQLAGIEDVDDHVLFLLHPFDPGLVLLAVGQVDLARGEGEIAARVGEDVPVDDLLELRLATEIPRVGEKRHRLLRLVLVEHEGAGADRLLGELLAHLLARLLAYHVAALVVDEQPEQARHLVLQGDPDGVLVDGLDLVEILEVARERGTLGIGRAGQRIEDVIGGELAVAVMALHAFAQAERPLLAVRRRFPALGEVAFHQCGIRIHRAWLHPHEAVEHPCRTTPCPASSPKDADRACPRRSPPSRC